MKRPYLFLLAAGLAATSQAETKKWLGTDSTSPTLASVDANWDPSGAPSATDDVVLTDGSNPLVWDLAHGVGSWTQSGYSGTVTFRTGRDRTVGNAQVSAVGEEDADGEKWFVVTGDITLNGGTWTHEAQPSFKQTDAAWTDGRGLYSLLVKCGGAFTLGSGAKVDLDGQGYRGTRFDNSVTPPEGPGAGAWKYGASHGGRGATYRTSNVAQSIPLHCYGSVKRPVTLGSGGAGDAGSKAVGSDGGGTLRLEVAGKATIDGSISASGKAVPRLDWTKCYYSSAGGSVFVKAGSLAGSGSIAADGLYAKDGGCGGGGRVALVLTGRDGSGDANGFGDVDLAKVTASGGIVNSVASQSGTIYLETADDGGNGELRVVGGNITQANSDTLRPIQSCTELNVPDEDYAFSKITLDRHAIIGVGEGVTVKAGAIDANVTGVVKSEIFLQGGQLQLPDGYAMENVMFCYFSGEFPFAFADGASRNIAFGNGTVVSSETLETLEYPGDVTLLAGATMTHAFNKDAHLYDLRVKVNGDLTVEDGAAIDCNAKGYGVGKGEGADNFGAGFNENDGGSHGGTAKVKSGIPVCYDSVLEPVLPGAGAIKPSETSLRGGGVAILEVTGATRVDGAIRADGHGVAYTGAAGGTVNLRTGSLSGTGMVSANGGSATSTGAIYMTGGGGRVAVRLTKAASSFGSAPAITAYGGRYGSDGAAGAGTVYLQTADEGEGNGRVVVDNGDRPSVYGATRVSEAMPDEVWPNVVISSSGRLVADAGVWLKVKGDWLNAGGFDGDPGSTVELVGGNAQTVTGLNSFFNFRCVGPGKTLRFGAGDGNLVGVQSGGSLTLRGDDADNIVLTGASADAHWPLAIANGGTMDIAYADISWSDAGYGDMDAVAQFSRDGGNNEHWSIAGRVEPGETILWTGDEDSVWGKVGNWDRGRMPVETDRIVIPPTNNAPVIVVDVTALDFVVQPGASVVFGGGNLSVSNDFTCAGSVTFDAPATIAAGGGFSAEGATFAGTKPSVALLVAAEGGLRTAAFGALGYGRITLGGSGAVAIVSGFSADELAVESSAMTVTVAAGTAMAVDKLALAGDSAAAIVLTSDAPWSLRVANLAQVVGVSVSNCNASGGVEIVASAPHADNGGNVNWRFSAGALARWTGGASGDFAVGENWSTHETPDSETFAVIPEDVTVTASAEVGVRSLLLGGKLVASAGLVVGDEVEVTSRGVLQLDAPSTVGGTFVMRGGGVLTHGKNADVERYRLELAVGGDFFIEAGAAIDVCGCGFASSTSRTVGYGPAGGIAAQCAASHGGYGGWYNNRSQVFGCYGSVFAPVSLGSGGLQNANLSPGGGAVRLKVAGVLRNDGAILADGSRSLAQDWYSGSGGSVFITTGKLVGAGEISACGGYIAYNNMASGGGGRIAIYETVATDWTEYTGTVEAHGGFPVRVVLDKEFNVPRGAAGTIYRETAADRPGYGVITVDNANGAFASAAKTVCTELPASQAAYGADARSAFRHARLVLSRKGMVELSRDLTLDDVDLPAGTTLKLNGHTLTLHLTDHIDRKGWQGTVVEDGGTIVWRNGLMFMIR